MLENDDLQKYNGSEVVVTVLDKQMPKEQALEKKKFQTRRRQKVSRRAGMDFFREST